MEQPGEWHSGLGGASGTFFSKAWQFLVGYAYGVDAIRDDHRGAHTVGFCQVDLEARRRPQHAEPDIAPLRSRVCSGCLEIVMQLPHGHHRADTLHLHSHCD